jgi:hypothetical protein
MSFYVMDNFGQPQTMNTCKREYEKVGGLLGMLGKKPLILKLARVICKFLQE